MVSKTKRSLPTELTCVGTRVECCWLAGEPEGWCNDLQSLCQPPNQTQLLSATFPSFASLGSHAVSAEGQYALSDRHQRTQVRREAEVCNDTSQNGSVRIWVVPRDCLRASSGPQLL